MIDRVANVGAAEFFRTESTVPAQFDKILLMNSLHYIPEPRLSFEHALKTLRETGRILIVHRAAPMCTLPLFSEARERMLQYDQSYVSIIKDLQAIGCDVQWEIECLTIRMSKMRWMSMINDRFPSEFHAISQHEVLAGLRELSEGVMKYTGEIIEFPDRLMFITAQRPVMDTQPTIARRPEAVTSAKRHQSPAGQAGGKGGQQEQLHYHLRISSDVRALLKEKEAEEREKRAVTRQKREGAGGILP